MRIAAVILAAGAGRRVGVPKALLPLGGGTFLQALATLLDRPGVAEILAVLGHEAGAVAAAAGGRPIRFVHNPRPDDGMLGSVLLGLDAAEAAGVDAVLLHPVDHPLVTPAVVDAVITALQGGAVIAVPSHAGRRGHPAGFARAAWPALRLAPPERGARAVLAEHPEWVVHVPGDRSCREGIDTRGDYERLIGPFPDESIR